MPENHKIPSPVVPACIFKQVMNMVLHYLLKHSPLATPEGKALCLLKTQFAKKPKNPV